ncbi:MAG: GAP family protein [Solirubrobacterales bacterium]|nr:GAP family protein [Solirubrobacterales bacterium]
MNLALFAIVWIPLAGCLVAPAATQARLESLNVWAHAHRRLAIVVVAGVIGAYLIIVGVTKRRLLLPTEEQWR